MHTRNGFTLIEVVIYLGIFTILVGGGILAAYNLIESNVRSQTETEVYDEGNFLLSKINWAITGTTAITAPVPGTPGGVLQVTKTDGTSVTLELAGTDMVVAYGNASPITLNNSSVKVSNLSFNNQVSSTSQSILTGLTVTATTDDGKSFSQDFTTSKYIRK